MSTAVKQSQTQPPARARLERDKNRHYVFVEGDGPNYDSPILDYLDKPSLVNPNEFMYTKESDDRMVTGHRNKTLLSCSKEDYERLLKENEATAMAALKPQNNPDESDFTRIEQDGKTQSDGVF